jgi:hypothetical protein
VISLRYATITWTEKGCITRFEDGATVEAHAHPTITITESYRIAWATATMFWPTHGSMNFATSSLKSGYMPVLAGFSGVWRTGNAPLGVTLHTRNSRRRLFSDGYELTSGQSFPDVTGIASRQTRLSC